MSKLVTAAHASAPSGESVGDAMRLIAHSASTESGGLAAARRVVAADSCSAGRRHRTILVGTMGGRDSTVRAPSARFRPKDRTMTAMNYRRLGASGLKVSELSFGSWVTYGNQLGADLARECMAAAFDAGVNFFDNAEVYAKGRSETIMGEVLKKAGWRRSSYIVSTKFFWGLHDGPNEKNTLNRKYLTRAIDGSLERLGLDYVDLVFCHRPDPETPIEETVHAMHDIIAAGKAVYWGTSEWSAAEIMAAWHIADRHHLHKPVMEQPQYNLLHRERVEQEYARLYADIGLGTTIWSPLASGLLTGKYNDGIPAGHARHAQGLRMARRAAFRQGQDRRRPAARSDRSGARLHARANVARVVSQESARVDGDHRRKPSRAGRREHEGARRRAEAHARRDGAHRRRAREATWRLR